MVVASDRMITASYPPVEFEHDVPKLEEIGRSCVALTAGDALAHVDLFRTAKGAIGGLSAPSIQHIAEVIRSCYTAERLKTVGQRVLGLRGWSLEQFYGELPRIIPPDVFMTVDYQIANYDYGLEILVAGVDAEAHIYTVRNPGHTDCFDSLGYNAIGSGGLHSLSTFISNGCSGAMSLNQGVYLVFEAKRAAEIAPGVGSRLDMAIVTRGNIHILSDVEIKALDDIHKERTAPHTEATEERIAALPFEEKEQKEA